MSVTLTYFGIPGRAEGTRVALAYAGIEYEDKRVTFQEYGSSKWAGKGLPVLEMDGGEYFQSTALLRYAGKLAGLYPEDPLLALQVDEIVMLGDDIANNMSKVFGLTDDTLAKEILGGKVKTLLDMIVSRVAKNTSSKFCVGDTLTIADLQLHQLISHVESGVLATIPKTLFSDMAPSLKDVQAAVLEDPKVKAFYAARSES